MPPDTHELAQLLALIGAAEAEAERLGPRAGQASQRLAEARRAVEDGLANGDRPSEGLTPAELTTGNDI